MGYSCSAMASLVLDGIMSNVSHVNNCSNVWSYKNVAYMYERGREQNDGAITGTISKFTDPNCTMAVRVGSFRIEGDGMITRFPGTSKNAKNSAIFWASFEYIRRFGFPKRHTIGENHPCRDILCNSPFVAV